jgi:hypothetical protein
VSAPDAVIAGVLAEHVALGDDAEGIEQCSCGVLAIWRRDSADDEDEVRYLPTHAEGPDLRIVAPERDRLAMSREEWAAIERETRDI